MTVSSSPSQQWGTSLLRSQAPTESVRAASESTECALLDMMPTGLFYSR